MILIRDNAKAFHAPLHAKDTAAQTIGCRNSQPEVCGRNCMPNVCAFVRQDGMCLSPPMSWPKQFNKLKQTGSRK